MTSNWKGAIAIVTGAASGIGLALSSALLKRGAIVWMVDVDAAGVNQAAAKLGSSAHPVVLDVRDAPGIRDLVQGVARDSGRLDFLFNNAGIGMGGEVYDLTVEHFDRVIDVNIRGVVNGSVAAYPLMVKQRSGHIVNTASLAGLTAVPLLTPYAMTKHAVVGFSSSLRLEATNYGVRVSALCPGAIETPILDKGNPSDLPPLPWKPNARRYLASLAGRRPPYPAGNLAEDALRGVERNQELIISPANARIGAFLYRMLPGMLQSAGQKALMAERKYRPMTA